MRGQPGNQFLELTKPAEGEIVIQKNVNSAFIGTNLQEILIEKEIENLVVVGLTTDHCVSTSVRMAGNYGYNTYLVEDATATFDKIGVNGEKFPAQLIHDTALASLNEEFATVITTSDVVKLYHL